MAKKRQRKLMAYDFYKNNGDKKDDDVSDAAC